MNRKGPRRGPQAHLGQPPRGMRGKRHGRGKSHSLCRRMTLQQLLNNIGGISFVSFRN